MITIPTTRSQVETIQNFFFPYVNLLKESKLHEARQVDPGDRTGMPAEEYLNTLIINQLLDDVEFKMKKRLINTKSQKVKLIFNTAEGIVLFKTLLRIPLDPDQMFLNMLRNQWVDIINRQIIV